MAEKHRHFPCEALDQTWTGDGNFKKIEEDAIEHRARSFSNSEMINKLAKMAACSRKHMYDYCTLSDRQWLKHPILNPNLMY